MKTICYWILTATLLFSGTPANAQEHQLAVGDTLPNLSISGIMDSKGSLQLADLYREGPLIINFWASWCVPCIRELRLLDSMAAAHPRLNVLSVTYEDDSATARFFAKRPQLGTRHIRVAAGDTLLRSYFFHQALPHNVWIAEGGRIHAITGGSEMTAANIKVFLDGRLADMAQKEDIPFDYRKPMQVPDSLLHFRSIFQPRLPGINIGGIYADFSQWDGPRKRIFAFNQSRLALIWMAFRKDASSHVNHDLIELHTDRPADYYWPESRPELFAGSGYADRRAWLQHNTFNYELRFPERVSDSVFFSFMQRDISHNLGVRCYFEDRPRMCRVVKADNGNQLELADVDEPYVFEVRDRKLVLRNVPIDHLLRWITSVSFGWRDERSRPEPYMDETGLHGNINATIDIDAFMDDKMKFLSAYVWEDVLQEQLGLRFSNESRLYPVLIVIDNAGNYAKRD